MTPTIPVFDSKVHLEQRNAAEQARKEGKEPPVKPVPAAAAVVVEEPPANGDGVHRPSRSERRLQNRLREEIGELRGRLKAYEELGLKPGKEAIQSSQAGAAAPVSEDPEPQRRNFADDASYNRALGKWDARQEARKETARIEGKLTEQQQQSEELGQLRAEIAAAEETAQNDIKELFPDWEKVSKEALDDPDAPEFIPADHPMLMMMIARSDVKARVLYHFATHPEVLESMLEMTKTPDKQIRAFQRLEGRLEVEYTRKQKAAQAAEPKEDSKQRAEHPAEAKAGRSTPSTSESDARKPRPSNEVSARGGTAVPEEPAVGSAAWMAARNARTGGR